MSGDRATPTEQVPLSTIYLQIENATTPSSILGITEDASEAEIKEAYRALAIRIHPDKAPSDSLRDLHTSLFQKLAGAFVQLLHKTGSLNKSEGEISRHVKSKRLPETEESLHARNLDAREALQKERQRATATKYVTDHAYEVHLAKLKAREEKSRRGRDEKGREVLREQEERKERFFGKSRDAGDHDLADDSRKGVSMQDLLDAAEALSSKKGKKGRRKQILRQVKMLEREMMREDNKSADEEECEVVNVASVSLQDLLEVAEAMAAAWPWLGLLMPNADQNGIWVSMKRLFLKKISSSDGIGLSCPVAAKPPSP